MERKRALLSRAQGEDGFLEAEARRGLGLLREDEIEFRFVDADGGGEERLERRRE